MPSIIGTAPNQIPTNGDLGTLAFQDSDGVRVGILQVDSTASSVSTTTGAVIVAGGVGVAGTMTIGGQVLISDGAISLPGVAFLSTPGMGMRKYGNSIAFTIGGVDQFNMAGGIMQVPSTGAFSWSQGLVGSNSDLWLYRDGANILAQRNVGNAQTLRVYNTFTDASNYERISIDWTTTVNAATIVVQSAGTGLSRNLNLQSPSALLFQTQGSNTRWGINPGSGNNFAPGVDNTYDIGALNTRVRGYFGSGGIHLASMLRILDTLLQLTIEQFYVMPHPPALQSHYRTQHYTLVANTKLKKLTPAPT